MSFFRAVLIILSCISLVVGGRWSEAWKVHKARVYKMFPCKVPQPRVFYLEDLVEDRKWKNELQQDKIVPFATILHRCESTGCCKNQDERCLPVDNKIENVKLIFANFKGGPLEFFPIEAKNHTECACQKIDDNTIKK